jgi:hypothetical protein
MRGRRRARQAGAALDTMLAALPGYLAARGGGSPPQELHSVS